MKANQLLALTIATAATGCAAIQPSPPADDPVGSDAGSGSDSTDGGVPAPDWFTGSVLDERADVIDFSTGEPVHAHSGTPIDLTTGCPDVYKYGYLESPHLYGRETAPNLVAWQLRTSAAQVDYRVIDDAGDAVIPSTPIHGGTDGTYTIAPDASALRAGKMLLEIHVDGVVRTACWTNHPLAAPLQVGAMATSDMSNMQLPAHAYFSRLMNASNPVMSLWPVPFAQFAITQTTGEPITFALAASPITGTATRDIAYASIELDRYTQATSCGTTPCSGMSQTTHDVSPPAPLAAHYELDIFDVTAGTWLCGIGQLSVACTIPPRAEHEEPHVYAATLAVSSMSSIAPPTSSVDSATYNDELVGGTWVSGLVPSTASSGCLINRVNPGVPTTYTCRDWVHFKNVAALNHARIVFDPITMELSTFVGDAATITARPQLPAFTWDTGVGDF